jgi:outer membrane protein assembly complex protein YaeT
MCVRAWLGLLILGIAIGGAACHEESGVTVKSLTFKGNSAFDSARLKAVLATRQSGWLPWSAKNYFDRAEFDTDLRRLQAFYVDRGYPNARVAGVDVDLNKTRDAVDLTINIDEGKPVLVDAVHFEGFNDLPSEVRQALNDMPLKAGQPHDRELVRASRDLGARLLRDNGYAHVAVEVVERPAAEANHLLVTLQATPGPKCYFGEIALTGLESVSENIVRRELTFLPGDLYRESDITRSQQRLTALELFQFAHIDPRGQDPAATEIPVRVTVAEGPPRRLKLGAGYGSEERVRGSLEWKHLNLFGGAQQMTAEAKWSSIERGLRVSFIEPYIIRRGLSLNLSATSWHTSQLTYETGTYGGRATLTFHSDRGLAGPREPVHREIRFAYIHEYLRYGITAQSLKDLSLREERIALGLDPDTGRSSGTLAGFDLDVDRVAVDDALNPHRGTITSVHFEDAARSLGGSYRFAEVLGEARAFVPIGKTVVLANRIRVGTLMARNLTDMPFSERYFLGGSTSVRGWGRFQISPLDVNGLPIGGRSMAEMSSEVRFPIRGRVSGVMFVDAGNVWSESRTFRLGDLRYAAGPGLRYLTPIGAIRGDLGFQLNRIPGLVINGNPEARRWRVHFSIGQSF